MTLGSVPQVPSAHLLSNGRYRVIVTDGGGGYSAWQDIALTRWAPDRTRDLGGLLFYLRDLGRGHLWSAAWRPVPGTPDRYDAIAEPGRLAIEREEYGIGSRIEVAVDPAHDTEFRVLTLSNRTSRECRLEVTSYLEVTLNDPVADTAHPAFSKLFVETEHVPATQALLARRRTRSPEERRLWMGHWLGVEGGEAAAAFETDRARFIGRARSLDDPAALAPGVPLSGSIGPVLDPALALRLQVTLAPAATARLVALVAAGTERDAVAARLGPLQFTRADAVLRDAATRERELLRSLGITEDHHRLAVLTGALLTGVGPITTPHPLPERSSVTATELTALGISSPAPLALARVRTQADRADLESLARIVAWWRGGGLPAQLLVIEDGVSAGPTVANSAGVVVHPISDIAPELVLLAERCARVTLASVSQTSAAVRPRTVNEPVAFPVANESLPAHEELQAFNGYGGFSADGSEYVLRLERDGDRLRLPPRPWTNVVANETAGFIASEAGAGYTWTVNSRENRLTPWSNDPVLDPPGEALYLRDDDRGLCWSPTPGPMPGGGAYETRHGFGYTVWRHTSLELEQETTAFVPRRDGLKIVRLRLTNQAPSARRLSLWFYAQWVLGTTPDQDGRFIVTAHDAATGAMLAVHPHRGPLARRVAFACVAGPTGIAGVSHTADRTAFLGRDGSPRQPMAVLDGTPLDGRTGAGLDPCAAFRVPLDVPARATVQCTVVLGEADDRAAALELCRRYRGSDAVAAALQEVRQFWRERLGRLQVTTPVAAIDLMVNGWLAYQNLSCRMWGRSAFYQSGGAFGFRDQLQDSSALVWLDPATTRGQILLHAAHQFHEGDVMHWWHPPDSRGIRTRFADDPLWLPFVTSEYVRHTGDAAVLREPVRFIEGPALAPDVDRAFFVPTPSAEHGDLYEHCVRSLDRSLTRGVHGLPLIAGGDWNDGMNRVGRAGRGESVWLGFFLYEVLQRFIPWCEQRGDLTRAVRYRAVLAGLAAALNDGGWDGAWYRRAFYDDGTPIGSAQSDECRIDAIAQAWAVLSGAAPTDRAERAMDSLEQHLVDERAGIIRLLTPPFDRTPHDPGYIKGYVPGVRENGGQYTHGVLWAIRALAELGRADRAAALLEMTSPVTRARSLDAVAGYQAEPYVVAADIYGAAPHIGRAGWTWYTGAAGWMLRVAVESVLGLTVLDGTTLLLTPCIPPSWPGFSLRYRTARPETTYEISVEQPRPRPEHTIAAMDAAPVEVRDRAVRIPLLPDGATHQVRVCLGADVGPRYRPRPPAAAHPD